MLFRDTSAGLLVSGHEIDHLLGRWGYALVFVIVVLQSGGAPVPGTTALAAAAIYAGSTHRLAIAGVIAAATAGAVAGYCVSFALGRWGGWRLLERHGHRVRLTPRRLALGRSLYDAHGGKIVFFGRFVTGLRTWGAFIAGSNLMPWPHFLVINLLGGSVWAVTNGLGYFYFGDVVSSASTGVEIALVVAGFAMWITTVLALRKRARRFDLTADRSPAKGPD